MVPSGPAGNRSTESEEPAELNLVSGPRRLVSTFSSMTSLLFTATGGWGKWLFNSASDHVSEPGAESVRRGPLNPPGSKQPPPPELQSTYAYLLRHFGDGSSHSSSATNNSNIVSTSSIDSGTNHVIRSIHSKPHPFDDNIICVDRTNVPVLSRIHLDYAQNDYSTKGPFEEPNVCMLEEATESVLPVRRTNAAVKHLYRSIAMSDASFISDMATSAPSFYANCTQNREQQVQQPEPETGIFPEKVTEELFWRRFHARVLQMVEEKQLSIHLSKVTAPTKALDDSESEEDISWEDLGSDDGVILSGDADL
ncbi:hypothetical protein, conserved [Eimeria maxima]|uniref:BSD domain-containing protein n=1 Tax=Eimeria maxima TaxID=5804 RepID=U6M065_EIMMA|nr:hypothetical protein, conserved [Eimeria maxima]CDJ57406.1 hypothetical protein, conserved [Eimeria maxima]